MCASLSSACFLVSGVIQESSVMSVFSAASSSCTIFSVAALLSGGNASAT